MKLDYSTVSENRWLKLIDYPIFNEFHRIIFLILLGIISLVGGLVNLFIIAINIMHKLRFFRENDYYSSPPKTRSTSSMISNLSGKSLSMTFDSANKKQSIYFSALSSQARFRYSHVILALSIFHLISNTIFIPILEVHVCADVNIELVNNLIMVSMAWMPFQVLFMSVFLFINTCIQFLSICYPLQFRLKRSPLLVSFILILLICLGHSSSCRFMVRYEIYSILDLALKNTTDPEVEQAKRMIEIALTIPFAIYCITGVCTIGFYMTIIRNINFGHHLAVAGCHYLEAIGEVKDEEATWSSNLPRAEEHSRRWNRLVKRNLQNLVMLATTTTIFYISEIPIFLAQYDHVAPKYWTLVCHCSVHLTCSMSHIILSKQFQKAALEIIKPPRRTSIELQLKQLANKEVFTINTAKPPKDDAL